MSLQHSLLVSECTAPVDRSQTYMARWSRRVRTGAGLLLVLVTTAVCYLCYELFSLLAEVVTGPGACIVAVCLFLLLLRSAVETLIFPGSLMLWRRTIESDFCKEMATQTLLRLKDLRNALETLAEATADRPRSRGLPRSLATTIYAKKTIGGLIGTFTELREIGVIFKDQRRLLVSLEELRDALTRIRLKVANRDTPQSLWEWIDHFSSESVSFASLQDVDELKGSMQICRKVESLLYLSCGRVSLYQRSKRWLSDTTLGHISQMRAELLARFRGEQVWVDTANGGKIDCVWIPAAVQDAPTILFCNPNGGFYEFASYQSEWLEFYNSLGINVMMWNYRGYGRTKGRPAPSSLKKDGVAVAEHLKSVRRIGLFGVHGESLGGMVATHIARTVGVDLLIADRTFASLEAVARFGFGKVAHRVFQALTWWETDTVEDYLHASCYKLVCADPNDSMINDFASLKSGIAMRLLSSHSSQQCSVLHRSYFHILNQSETEELREALSRFVRIILYFNKRDGERSPRSVGTMIQGLSQISGQSNYQMLGPDTDAVLEDESLLATVYRLYTVIDNLDAGGKSLASIPQNRDSLKHVNATADSIQLWLTVMDVWGSYRKDGDMSDPRQCAIAKTQETIATIESICEECRLITNPLLVQLFAQARVMANLLGKVYRYLEETTPESPGRKSGSSGSTLPEKSVGKVVPDWTPAGNLLPLSCGHNGPLSTEEKSLLEGHLLRAQFLKPE